MAAVIAEMAGVIAEILIKKGDTVSAGQEIAILESMKMQIPIASPQAGTVAEVKVQAGDFVNEGDEIAVLE